MKKSFMTRVLAVSLSAAMAFSLSSASNLMTASAANATVKLKTTFKTLKVKQTYKLTLTSNTLNWKITKVTTTNKQICTVYGKTSSYVMLKGKGVGRATIKVKTKTTKRKYPKNIKWMSCRVNVKEADQPTTPVTPEPEEFSISASASSNEKVTVTFSQAVDEATANNFTINGVTVTGVELSADKKTATLTISGASSDTEYTLSTSGLKVNGADAANKTTTFKTPPAAQVITDDYKLVLSMESVNPPYIESNGRDTASIICELQDKDGKVVTDKEVEIEFKASRGRLASERVTSENGVAKNTFTSESSPVEIEALITATVAECKTDPKLIGVQMPFTIIMTPDPDQYNTTVGAVITGAESNAADRVIGYFNKDVNVDDYLLADHSINPDAATITIHSGINNFYGDYQVGATKVNAIGLLPVDGNTKAMQILVDKPLIDNSIVRVQFEDKTGNQSVENTAFFKLTDARQPSALKVTPNGYREFEVDFSEAVLFENTARDNRLAGIADPLAYQYSADRLAAASSPLTTDHYLLDGTPISDAKYGVAGSQATISVGYYTTDGVDNRHKVTIRLGKDSRGKRIYLQPGKHTLQIGNVGDWAANTDFANNIQDTQTLDFEIAENNTVPNIASIDVQSPEQYLVTFNCPVDENVLSTKFRRSGIELEAARDKNGESMIRLLEGSTDIGASKNPIVVTRADSSNTKYLVEVTEDWTQVYNTSSSRKNYFNYIYYLFIEANDIENIQNGLTNSSDIKVELESGIGSIKVPDEGNVQLTDVEQVNSGSYYRVLTNEPIKLGGYDDQTNSGFNSGREGLTPSQEQNLHSGVPTVTAEFINDDNSESVEAEILGFDRNCTAGMQDMAIMVRPKKTLAAGGWRVVVRSASDDVGNTAGTLSHPIEVVRPAQTKHFRVVWAAVAKESSTGPLANGVADYNEIISGGTTGQGEYIFIKFSEPIATYGNAANALSQANYTIGGKELPQGTQILAGINGYDNRSNQKGGPVDSITIVLPKGSTVSTTNAVVNISNYVTSAAGERLTGEHEIRMPYQFNWVTDLTTGGTNGVNTRTNAVWGDDNTEKATYFRTAQAYTAALNAALDADKYRTVILTGQITDDTLEITRPVNLDLNGITVENINVAFSNPATVNIYNSNSSRAAKISGDLIVNTPNADFALNTNSKDSKITINNRIDVNGVIVEDVLPATFINGYAAIGKLTINDSNGVAVEDENKTGYSLDANGKNIKRVVIDTIGSVKLVNKFAHVTAARKADLTLDGIIDVFVAENAASGITITLADADAEITAVFGNEVIQERNNKVVDKTDSVTATQVRDATNAMNRILLPATGNTVSNNSTVSGGAFDIVTVTSQSALTIVNVEVKNASKTSNAQYLEVNQDGNAGFAQGIGAVKVTEWPAKAVTEYVVVTCKVNVAEEGKEAVYAYVTKEIAITLR